MPDFATETVDELRDAAAAAVVALPGVVRLEPTLSNALRRLQAVKVARAVHGRPADSAAEGIRLTRDALLIDIHVDITVDTTHPAAVTAQEVQDTLRDTVGAYDFVPGQVSVTVLRLEP